MTGKGILTTEPNRKLRWIMAAHAFWLVFVGVQSAWWTSLVHSQADQIVELEARLGIATPSVVGIWSRTQRMLHWEATAFFLVMLAGSAFLVWLYWRDALRSRSTQAFFASVTHELRTPLTSIRLQAESIAESLPANGPDAHLVQRLLEDTSRLESQVDRTLELARMEGGGRVRAEAMRLRPAVERALTYWGETYRDRAELKSDLGHDLTIRADVASFQVVLRNLLENSIRHSRKDKVSVTVDAVPGGDPGQVGLRFADDGAGFRGEAADLGKLFAKGEASAGTGVGLYLVRVLMERMGGRAEFRPSSAGHGFEVVLWFLKEAADGR